MQITTATLAQASVLELKGRMDIIAAMQYEQAIAAALAAGARRFVLDLGGLEYISSAGLRSLLATSKKIKQADGQIHICGLKGAVKDVFSLSGFDAILPVFASLKDALPA